VTVVSVHAFPGFQIAAAALRQGKHPADSSLVRAWLCSKFVSVQQVSPLPVSGNLFWQLAALIFISTTQGIL